MSTSLFQVTEHKSPCQHIREYPRGTKRRQEDVLEIAIKQYTPLNVNESDSDAVTIIAAPANGFPKVSHSLDAACPCLERYMHRPKLMTTSVLHLPDDVGML